MKRAMLEKPAQEIYLLPLMGLGLLIYSLLARGPMIDIHLHDTYYVFSPITLAVPVAMYLFANAGIYFLRPGSSGTLMLTRMHVWLTIGGLLIIILAAFCLPIGITRYGGWREANLLQRMRMTREPFFLMGIILLLAALIILIANLAQGTETEPYNDRS